MTQTTAADPSANELQAEAAAAPRISRRRALAEVILIFAVFLVHAGLQPPAVNETNYLAKAKHYWNPQWCSGDLFLESADPHAVFYWICGWWTLWLSLPTVAIVGRAVTYLLLAFSWRRLSAAVLPLPWWSVLSAALMVAFTSRLHMAGEWVVGGFESKGLAFALVFLALEAVVRGRWQRVWPLLGLASALHVLVGGWCAVAASMAWISSRSDAERPTLRAMLPSLILGALLSLPGLIPTLRLDWGTDRAVILKAAQIQVFDRLGHHLNPDQFMIRGGLPTEFALRFFALTVVCIALLRWQAGEPWRRLERVVQAALMIAVIGLVICEVGIGVFQARAPVAWVLRFYWFRLADAMVPIGAALAIAGQLSQLQLRRPALATAGLALALCVAAVPLVWQTYDRMTVAIPAGDIRLNPTTKRFADWLDVCEYAADPNNIPPSALFLTPSGSQTFKWYAQRPEVATWKEMPQDAASIVRWWDRLVEIHGPPGDWQPPTRLTTEQIVALGRRHHAQYLLAANDARIDLDRKHWNNSFAIYVLPP